MSRNTILVEIREQEDSPYADMMSVIDDLNDILSSLSQDLEMDILSVSHAYQVRSSGQTNNYSTTCIFLLNGQTAHSIVQHLTRSEHMHAFVSTGGKVSAALLDRAAYCERWID